MRIGLWLVIAIALECLPVRAQSVVGPVPRTGDSYPMMASDRLYDPVDLTARGYVEEEYFVSGLAGVYGIGADGRPARRGAEVEYTTRVLVRRPSDAAEASGNVIVELPNTARRSDAAFVWSLSSEHFMREGDTWVGVTFSPTVIEALRDFDRERYADLAMPNPLPGEACGRGNAASDSEEGLRWDAIAHIGSLLRSGAMLGGIDVQRIYAASHQPDLETWAGTFHDSLRLDGGTPVFDGYIIHRDRAPASLSRCGPIGRGVADLESLDVPVIRIVAEGDVLAALDRRKADSDGEDGRYRLYEVAGAPHADAYFYSYMPTLAVQEAIGTPPLRPDWPFDYECTPPIALTEAPMMRYVANAAFAHLDRWARDGVAPPRAERIAVDENGAIERDAFGNAVGGVRTPQLDVASWTYVPQSDGPGACGNLLHTVPVIFRAIEATYGGAEGYRQRFLEAVDRLEEEGLLVPADAAELRVRAESLP